MGISDPDSIITAASRCYVVFLLLLVAVVLVCSLILQALIDPKDRCLVGCAALSFLPFFCAQQRDECARVDWFCSSQRPLLRIIYIDLEDILYIIPENIKQGSGCRRYVLLLRRVALYYS